MISTSRTDGVSGIKFFRCSSGLLVGQLGDDIDVISHGYRYALVWPSKHPESGDQYRWLTSDGEMVGIPNVGGLPWVGDRFDEILHGSPSVWDGFDLDGGGPTPWAHFEVAHDCHAVLLDAGFSLHGKDRHGHAHYTRPGKDSRKGSSATVWADGCCTPFSSSIGAPAEYLNGKRSLRPWQLHITLNFGGDFARAASDWRSRMNGSSVHRGDVDGCRRRQCPAAGHCSAARDVLG